MSAHTLTDHEYDIAESKRSLAPPVEKRHRSNKKDKDKDRHKSKKSKKRESKHKSKHKKKSKDSQFSANDLIGVSDPERAMEEAAVLAANATVQGEGLTDTSTNNSGQITLKKVLVIGAVVGSIALILFLILYTKSQHNNNNKKPITPELPAPGLPSPPQAPLGPPGPPGPAVPAVRAELPPHHISPANQWVYEQKMNPPRQTTYDPSQTLANLTRSVSNTPVSGGTNGTTAGSLYSAAAASVPVTSIGNTT